MRRLGLDHGSRRVGIALSDEEGLLATPLVTLTRAGDVKALLREVAQLAETHAVGEIVVGLPLGLDGREGAAARGARRFSELVANETGLPVVLWDERLSTAAAERSLVEAGVRRENRRKVVDQVAATLFLQSYLDAKRGVQAWPQSAEAENGAGKRQRGGRRKPKKRSRKS